MRMINRQQLLAAFAHLPLRGKEFFRCGLVGNQRVWRDVTQAIDRLCAIVGSAANQAAALIWRRLTRVSDDLIKLRAMKRQHSMVERIKILSVAPGEH